MFWRARSFWLSVAAVAYAAFAALEAQSSGRGTSGALPSAPPTLLGRGLPWLSMVALPIVLGAVWTMTAAPTRGEDRVDAAARSAARAAWAGAAIVLAAMTGPPTPGLAATANLGTAIATMAALVALARLSPMGGLVVAPESARGLDAVAFASLLWTVAIALPLARAVGVARAAALDPVVLDGAAVAASLGALGLATATALRIAVTRRLELGVAERADAALWLSATAVAVGVLGAAVGVGVPERLLPVTAVVASLAIVACAAVPDPAVLARTLRVVLAVAGLAAPFALGAVYVTQAAPRRAAATVFVSCVACALAGLAAPLVAARLTRSLRRTLGLLHQAITAATNPDPDLAVEAALHALGEGAALYRVVSGAGGAGDKLTVDRAGYAHTETAELPAALVEVADQEPERVLRAAAARAVEVRRPELRPIVAWLDRQRVAAVAVVRDETAPVALIALPTAPDGRAAPAASLEEVRALRALADRLGSVIGVSAALGRSRERELAGRAELGRVGDEARRLLAERDRDAAQRIALTRMLERPARVASYSPAARAAVEQLERMGEAGRPIALLSARASTPSRGRPSRTSPRRDAPDRSRSSTRRAPSSQSSRTGATRSSPRFAQRKAGRSS